MHGEAEVADGDFAIVADPDGGADAPDQPPPGTVWSRAYFGVVLGDGELVCGVWSGADFAVKLGLVGVGEECVEECIGGLDAVDGVGREERRKTFLPVVVAAFDFAFCLGRGGVAQGDARVGATARLTVYLADVGAQVASPQSPILRISTAILPFIPSVPTPFPLPSSLFHF